MADRLSVHTEGSVLKQRPTAYSFSAARALLLARDGQA